MIPIAAPSMCLNAVDVPPPLYHLWNTYSVPAEHRTEDIIDWISKVAAGAPGGHLLALVINCHGLVDLNDSGGYGLHIGAGIFRRDTPLFSRLSGLVDEIYIVACQAARISVVSGAGSVEDGDGNLLCCEISKQSGARVYASTADQSGPPEVQPDCIDDFEGRVYRYSPSDGSCQEVRYDSSIGWVVVE